MDKVLIARILASILNTLGVLNLIQGLINGLIQSVRLNAQEAIPFQIENIVANTQLAIQNGSYGLSNNYAQNQANTAAILLAIAYLTDGTTPVSLPATPPTGYGSGSSAPTVDDIWAGPASGMNDTPTEVFNAIQAYMENSRNFVARPMGKLPGFQIWGLWGQEQANPVPLHYPAPDYSDIRVTDDRLSWLTRTDPLNSWYADPLTGEPSALTDPADLGQPWKMQPSFTEGQFKTFPTTGILSLGPPVWPGLPLVTLGSPVALASTLTVTSPMDGVIVQLTTVPPGKPSYDYDGTFSYGAIGGIAFQDDNGSMEAQQILGFTQQIYTPRAMKQAAAVKLLCRPGISGTVTPWVIT